MAAASDIFFQHGYSGASTLAIASRARVSKRELYALFGSKQAILSACISWRAERMRVPLDVPAPPDHPALAATLRAFGAAVLREFCAPKTIAMYRLAIAEAERAPEVAQVLASAGHQAVDAAAVALLGGAVRAGLLTGDPAAIATTFFAILMQEGLALRLLMGLEPPPDDAAIAARAAAAAAAVLALYAAQPSRSARAAAGAK
jgi:AcrR family transcriptional regulator